MMQRSVLNGHAIVIHMTPTHGRYECTVLADVTHEMRIANEEAFGSLAHTHIYTYRRTHTYIHIGAHTHM